MIDELQRFGMTFLLGATLTLPGVSFSQEVENVGKSEVEQAVDPFANDAAPDPFAEEETKPVIERERGEKKTATLFLRVEVFEVPVMVAMGLLDEELSAEDLRKRVLGMVAEKKAKVASMHGTRFEAGSIAMMEGIVEDIYPTEYEPPEVLPEGSHLLRPKEQLSPAEKVALTFASPSAFDTKNLGTTLETEATVVTAEKGTWDLAFDLTEVSHLKDDSWVEGTVTMPIFKVSSAKILSRVKDGTWNLLSYQAAAGEDGKPDLSEIRLVLARLKQLKR